MPMYEPALLHVSCELCSLPELANYVDGSELTQVSGCFQTDNNEQLMILLWTCMQNWFMFHQLSVCKSTDYSLAAALHFRHHQQR